MVECSFTDQLIVGSKPVVVIYLKRILMVSEIIILPKICISYFCNPSEFLVVDKNEEVQIMKLAAISVRFHYKKVMR